MKFLLSLFLLMVAYCSHAAKVDLPALGEPIYYDMEVNETMLIQEGVYSDPSLRIFELDLVISNACPSNIVILLIGNDSNTNGYLEHAEANLEIGLSRAAQWRMRLGDFKEVYASDTVDTNTLKHLSVKIRVTPEGSPKYVIFYDNGTPFSFSGIDLSSVPVQDCFSPASFAACRLIRRGYFPENSSPAGQMSFSPGGLRLIVR